MGHHLFDAGLRPSCALAAFLVAVPSLRAQHWRGKPVQLIAPLAAAALSARSSASSASA